MSGKDKPREREEKREDRSLGGGSMMDNISKMIPNPMGEDTQTSGNESIEDSGAW